MKKLREMNSKRNKEGIRTVNKRCILVLKRGGGVENFCFRERRRELGGVTRSATMRCVFLLGEI